MVESLLQRTTHLAGQRPDLPEELSKAYLALLQQQVAEEIAWRVVEDVKADLTPEQLSSPAAVRERLTARLADLVPTSAPSHLARPATGAGCRSICLIGPTGVGKTTTIAKLAAALKLRQKQTVGLITIDTYRIAAVDQLRTYANIIGVPLKVVLTPTELESALHDMRHCDTVLIDTAGRSPADDLKLAELAGFVQAAKPTEVHLVLSSTCTQAAMEAALTKFSTVRVDQIIFTKLDEAVSFGVLLNVARKASKTLSYVTTGQDVPDHVEVGQPRRLAKLILGEKL
jgi:flagellar biosynthesis protein FlhF